jgi:hypothetical protein
MWADRSNVWASGVAGRIILLSAAAGPRRRESLGHRADVFGDLLLAIEFLPRR